MAGNRPGKGQLPKAPMTTPATGQRPSFAWPWGIVAVGIMALAWVGLYLIWQGIVFLLGL